MDKIHQSYYAVIPSHVRYDNELRPNAKLLYAEISALVNQRGYCWASNQYFADLYGISKKTVSDLISILAKKKYITVKVIRNEKNEVTSRNIYIPEALAFFNIPILENEDTSPLKSTAPISKNKEVYNRKNNKEEYNNPIIPKNIYQHLVDYCKGNEDLLKALQDFCEHRKSLRKPITTERTIKLLVEKLDKLSGDNDSVKVKLLDEAILNGWLTVYPMKDDSNGKLNKQQKPQRQERGLKWV